MASLSKRAGGWRAQVAIKGIRDSATFSTKAEAQAWAAQRETEIRKAVATGIVSGKTCQAAFDQYIKEVSAHKRGKRWEEIRLAAIAEQVIDGVRMGEMLLAEITPSVLGAWRDKRMQQDGVVGSTVNRELNLLSHVFTTARREWRWIAESPTKDVRRPKESAHRERRITDDEIDRICLALGFDESPVKTKNGAAALAFLFAIETAMRAGEICKLLPEYIVDRVAHLPASITKNGTKRDVPLSSRAVELLALLPEQTPVFGISTASLDALFRKARNRCLIDRLTFHDSRHEAITRLAKKLSVLALARMVGHRDLNQLNTYYNESAADMAEQLD
jgi:integrase